MKMLIPILLFLSINKITASPQSPDLLIYKGDTFGVYNLLLEQYFEKINKTDDIEGKLFGLNFKEGASFNCWRGYQAIYKIENDSLWLEHITSCNEYFYSDSISIENSQKRIAEIFGDKMINQRVLIDWFSGSFSIPKSNTKILRWDGVFYKIFEEEILIEVNKGKILNIVEIENYMDKSNRINRKYKDEVSSIIFQEIQKIKWKNIDKFDCSEEYLITIGKEGTIVSVIMPEYKTKAEINEFWDRKEYNYCLITLRKGLKNLKFDVIKKVGKPIEENIYIEIWFEDDGTIENWTN